ncbi:patatin-like phospholipase family protein [Winogradskyella eckloniae]|uniref:patatin-like phospholipase family protein n=1 Tax=Winogradskyella eckloniae TaxID=1089306 RepID=UPI0015637AB8|nr:patatin-like phospholipase family protein [Winogradskyella eckloniae]NRD20023.1 patatin-like phospholipase family protein [Winogradskyella eckloniae]
MGNENDLDQRFEPFSKIGLCFSGGGYRATFFTLGILSYLEAITYQNKPLLESVKAMSTVSGGTLTGVAYAKAVQDSEFNFKAFFKSFYNTFSPLNDILLVSAIQKFNNEKVWKTNAHKNRSLINAFALTYSEMPLFSGTFKSFNPDTLKGLDNVCFNATDFSFGLTYRFQNKGYFGNNPLYKYNQKEINSLKDQIELGDVIASSSCFPIGFEPLVFPDDYIKEQDNEAYVTLKKTELFKNGVGIMDGGITDNQGIGSMVLINDRMKHTDHGGLDLIIINDVGSYIMKPWQPDNPKPASDSTLQHYIKKRLWYFNFKPAFIIVVLVGLLLLILNNCLVFSDKASIILSIIGGFVAGVGMVLTTLSYLVSKYKTSLIAKLKVLFNKTVPEPLVDKVVSFKELDVNLVKSMIINRLTSSATMISDVFLKQIRRINYDFFYSKNDYKNKRITATIYKLNGVDTPYNKNTTYHKDIYPKPSTVLKSVCLSASETPTTLWWDQKDRDENRMDKLIACGQFTMCYELLEYIIELKKDLDNAPYDFKDLNQLESALQIHWKAFNDNPLWLVNTLK